MEPQIILADLPGASSSQRLRVAVARSECGQLKIDLRDQHYAEGIGWFDQRALSLTSAQFKELQAVLGVKVCARGRCAEIQAQDDERPATLRFPGTGEDFTRSACSRIAERA